LHLCFSDLQVPVFKRGVADFIIQALFAWMIFYCITADLSVDFDIYL